MGSGMAIMPKATGFTAGLKIVSGIGLPLLSFALSEYLAPAHVVARDMW